MGKNGQQKIADELRNIREHLIHLEERIDSLSPIKPPQEARLKTYVDGLDDVLDGGIPVGHVVLLAGPSGVMKTSLALYILQRNRTHDVKGLYITLEESRDSLLKTMNRLGIGTEEDFIVDIGKLRTEHEAAEASRDWLQILKDYLSRRLEKDKLDLVVVDPINSLYALAGIANPRKELFHFFSFLRSIGVTTLLVTEAEMNGRFFANQEDFLADGTLTLSYSQESNGNFGLQLRCLKMRHSNHSRANMRLDFTGGKFIVSALAPDERSGNPH